MKKRVVGLKIKWVEVAKIKRVAPYNVLKIQPERNGVFWMKNFSFHFFQIRSYLDNWWGGFKQMHVQCPLVLVPLLHIYSPHSVGCGAAVANVGWWYCAYGYEYCTDMTGITFLINTDKFINFRWLPRRLGKSTSYFCNLWQSIRYQCETISVFISLQSHLLSFGFEFIKIFLYLIL